MSHDATNWAIKQRGLKPVVKLLLWHLADRHNPDQGCFPKQETLAEDCEISRASVNRHLDELESLGLILREPQRDPQTNKQLPTRYRLACEPDFPRTQDVGGRVSNCDTESRVSKSAVSVSHSSETPITSKRTSKNPLTPDERRALPPQDVGLTQHVHAMLDDKLYLTCCKVSGHAASMTDAKGGWTFPVQVIDEARQRLALAGAQ
ncbi:Helix-turn-helix domain-containing protein [Devosia crocina]|uniref:Helix-turn-helix domain-containing protein n=1 Tax=Devosia crocina TaxID=429728 RepID=A0A1I7N9N9_9HYPH|nr:helix-turn-helix domain-containing protein [Devosia crocina]SFV31276.1 Helix-turn-helix domain-containing protein [Devosia crocina]